jgi:hypothetical protein
MTRIDKSKFLTGKLNLQKIDFSGTIKDETGIISTVNPLSLFFKGFTNQGDPIEITIYGEAQGDLVTGFGFAEIELDSSELSPLYCLSRFSILGSITNDRISLVGKGDLRNIYQLEGSIDFNVDLVADNNIIDKTNTTIKGFLQYKKPHNTLSPVTMKRLPNALYNKSSTETNINRLLRAYDKEILRVKTRIKMIESDAVIDLARHTALINNFSPLISGLSVRLFDIEDYRKVLKKVNDIILLDDTEDMLKEAVRFFTNSDPEIVNMTKFKMKLGSSRLNKDCYAIDRDLRAFTTKIIIKNPKNKNFNKKALIAFLKLFAPIHIKFIIQFEDGELVNF